MRLTPRDRLWAALAASVLAAVLVPLGSLLKDGGVLHGLAIGSALSAAALVATVLRDGHSEPRA